MILKFYVLLLWAFLLEIFWVVFDFEEVIEYWWYSTTRLNLKRPAESAISRRVALMIEHLCKNYIRNYFSTGIKATKAMECKKISWHCPFTMFNFIPVFNFTPMYNFTILQRFLCLHLYNLLNLHVHVQITGSTFCYT